MQTNFDLAIGEKSLLFLETSKNAGIRIVGEGRSGWGTIVTIESAKADVMGELSWRLERRYVFNSEGDMIDQGCGYKSAGDPTAEALMLVLIKQRQLTRMLGRSEQEATSEWHKNNPERMGR